MAKAVVVVLEDDSLSMGVFRRSLEIGGFECAEAQNEREAIEHCENHGGNVKALIADLILPTCRGTDVALALARLRPGIRVLFVSGTPVEDWRESDVRKMAQLANGSFAFLAKPFQPKRMLHELDRLLNSRSDSEHA
jgi:DNA-binding NtrC family response regulator